MVSFNNAFFLGVLLWKSASSWVLTSNKGLPAMAHHRVLEFGDYAEVPDECPATTSCPVVCVANETFCTTVCDDGLELCETGVCLPDCAAETHTVENPCTCEGFTFACAKVVDEYPTCFDRFQTFYDANSACLESQDESVAQVSFTGPYFLACYGIISGVTGLVFLWGIYNQVLSPVEFSTVPLENEKTMWTLTGYRRNPIGIVIYGLVILVLFGIQFLLFTLTIIYYIQQEAVTRWGLPGPIPDEVQVLKAFEIVWMVGFVWSFAFRYPSTGIWSLFLRRCTLNEAHYVTVVAPKMSLDVATPVPGIGDRIAYYLWCPLDTCMRLMFSWPYDKPGFDTVFCPVLVDPATGKRSFYHRLRRFVYDENDDGSAAFVPGTVTVGERLGDFLKQSEGLSSFEVEERAARVGRNQIPMKRPTVLGSILMEFSKAFYLYQNFLVWTWGPYWYYYMAIVNTCVRVSGGLVVGVFQYLSDSVLYKLTNVEGETTVLRDGERVTISNTEIVPGDVVVLSTGNCYCDMVILAADHIVVDESALTGEATPIVKTAIDSTMSKTPYDPKIHKSFTLSAGSEILEVGEGGNNLALVLTTASFTTKGKLLTEVLSYSRHKFKFDDEVKIVLMILVLEAIFLLGMVFYFLKEQWVYAWFYGMFILATVIPPLLPTVFVVSVGISADRLRRNRIACTYPQGILVAGKVNMAFFDKTGTLTKQGLDYISTECVDPDLESRVRLGMAVCHSLTTSANGDVLGNQVDKVSFESTGATLEQKKVGDTPVVTFEGKRYKILKEFEFDNHRATQSVIVEDESGSKHIFVKGSLEGIKVRCVASTVPVSFDKSAQASAKTGIYQLGIAYKKYDLEGNVADAPRDSVEESLTFGGLINFQNVMKEDTPEVIKEIIEGNIGVAMVTGDNIFTGIYIAKQAGIVKSDRSVLIGTYNGSDSIDWADAESDEIVKLPTDLSSQDAYADFDLAVTGPTWKILLETDPKYAAMIAKHVKVFGRCNPSDKVSVVLHFVTQGYITLMCGDGANDCGSLKSAHVGVALSTSEASVVAPFTSLDKKITSVPEVLREGRCALSSAFAAYMYYIIYGQTESILQTINAYMAITFTEWCWVFMDGIWSTLMAFSLPLAKAAKRLSRSRPTASLLGPRTMFSVCGILAWNFIFLVVALATLYNEDWFQCRKWNSDDVSNVRTIGDNYESSVLFLIGGWQYICSAMALNFGYSWREHWFRNYVFVFLATLFAVFQFVATIYPSKFSCIWRVNCNNEDAVRWVTTKYAVAINNPWNTTEMPVSFRWKMVAIMAANLATICIWQYYFVNGWLAETLVAMKKAMMVAKRTKVVEKPFEEEVEKPREEEEFEEYAA